MDQVSLIELYNESLGLLDAEDWNVRRIAYRRVFNAIDDALLDNEFLDVDLLLSLLAEAPFSELMAPILWQTSHTRHCFRFWRRAHEQYKKTAQIGPERDLFMQTARHPITSSNYEKCFWLVKQIKDLKAQRAPSSEISAVQEELGMRRLSLTDDQDLHVFSVLLDPDC